MASFGEGDEGVLTSTRLAPTIRLALKCWQRRERQLIRAASNETQQHGTRAANRPRSHRTIASLGRLKIGVGTIAWGDLLVGFGRDLRHLTARLAHFGRRRVRH
jgi:hypothetical protein